MIVEDEAKIARVLTLELQHEGYRVTHAEDGHQGLELALSGHWDLILLDIMLPKLNGVEVLRRIRQIDKLLPIIVLTARNTVPDKVSGLDLGANDYITKPFAIEELLARIRNLLRQSHLQSETIGMYRVHNLTIDAKTRTVKRDQQEIELTPREFELLFYLVKNKEQVLSREQIIADVWGYEFVGETNLVDVYIRYLRQKIDKGFKKNLIQTKRGVGYYIKEPYA